MFKIVSAAILSAFVLVGATNFIPNNSSGYTFPKLTSSMLAKYNTKYSGGDKGYNLYGNSLILNNVSKEPTDIDKSALTSNSASVRINSDGYSHAFLVYMVSGTKLNLDEGVFSALISSDAENYITATPEITGMVGKNKYVAILDISKTLPLTDRDFYLSLPLLEDTQNANNISSAGFYLVLLDSSGNSLSDFSFSLSPKSTVSNSLGLGLKSGSSRFLTNNTLRNPNTGFTEGKDIELGKSSTGDFGVSPGSGLIFINNLESNIPAPEVSIEVEQSSELSPYYRVSVDTKIKETLADSQATLSSLEVSNYADSSAIIPLGYPFSGMLSDIADNDPFDYDSNKIRMSVSNASLRSKVSFSMVYSTLTNNLSFTLKYKYLGKEYALKTNRVNLNMNSIWKDVGVYASISKNSKTSGELRFLSISDSLNTSSEIRYRLPLGIAISGVDLKENNCSVVSEDANKILTCSVSFAEESVYSISIPALFRLDPATIDFGEVEILSSDVNIKDYFPGNNFSNIYDSR